MAGVSPCSHPRRGLVASVVAVAVLALVAGCASSADDDALGGALKPSRGCGRPAPTVDAEGRVAASIESSGGLRQYLVLVPPGYSPDEPTPLAFMFHGAGSNKEQQLEYSEFGPVAMAGGALLVLPDAHQSEKRWSPIGPDGSGVDDLRFFDDLLGRIRADFCVDPDRVLVAGMSSGGFMAAAIGCQRSSRVSAVGAVTASLWVRQLCRDAQPVAYVNFHGTNDTVVPFAGGPSPFGLTTGPVEETAQGWATQNGCDGSPVDRPVGTEVVHRTWSGCDAATSLYIVQGGGHTWPGAEESPIGHTTQDVDASAIIWETFVSTWPAADQPG
jgi:polyhydroxybutyrate depolymerase